jgi:hypothetical protein
MPQGQTTGRTPGFAPAVWPGCVSRCGSGSSRLLRDGGHLSAARGPLYRVEDAQVLQAVARAHHRLRRAAYDRAEIFELPGQRISPFDGNCLAFERVRPGPSCRVGVESQAHGGTRQRAKRSGDDVTIFVGIGGEGWILPGRLFPASRRSCGVGQHERAQNPVREAQADRNRVLDRKVTGR